MFVCKRSFAALIVLGFGGGCIEQDPQWDPPASDTAPTGDGTRDVGTTDPTSSATDGGCSIEVCDGVDNDCDGLVDEYSADNTSCNDCNLHQQDARAYWVCTGTETWQSARDDCSGRGAQLVSVVDDPHNDFVHGLISTDAWIGLNDLAAEGVWVWADGSGSGYRNWAEGEPNDYEMAEDCVVIQSADAMWNDIICGTELSESVCWANHTE